MEETKGQQIIEIDVDVLQPNPLQPRGVITPESLVDLVDSIREHGVLEPLIVAKTPAGYQIIAGERRWRAAKIAGLKKVPAIVKETTPRGMLEMALVENVQRKDLNPLERAKAFQRLRLEFGLSAEEISRRIGKTPGYIVRSISLLSLPDLLKDGLLSGQITEGHAHSLGSLKDPKLITEAYNIVLQKNLSVRGVEELVRRIKAREKLRGASVQPTALILSPKLDKMEKDLRKVFAKFKCRPEVKISQSQVRGRILIIVHGSREVTSEALGWFYKKLTGKSLKE